MEEKHEKYIQQIENNNPQGVKSALEFEREILGHCKEKLQFFDSQQFVDLSRLREDRHRCAHPSFQKVGVPYEPSAEQSRLHIRNAVVHVLSQPPVQGKAALAELKTLVESKYFPEEKGKAEIQLKGADFNSANQALVKRFVDLLVFSFLTEDDALYLQRRALSALNATFEMYPHIVEERLEKQLNKAIRTAGDDNFSDVARVVANASQGWNVLDEASRARVLGFVEHADAQNVIPGLKKLHAIDGLKNQVEIRVGALSYDDLASAIGEFGLGDIGKERALSFLQRSGSWNRTNKIFKYLVSPIFETLKKEDIERIIRMPFDHDTDLLGANEFNKFLDEVVKTGKLTKERVDALLERD